MNQDNNQVSPSNKLLITITVLQIILIILVIVLSITMSIIYFLYMTFTLVLAYCYKSQLYAAWYSLYNLMLALLSIDQIGLIIIGKRPFVGKFIWNNIGYFVYFIGCAVLSYLGYLLYKQFLKNNSQRVQELNNDNDNQTNRFSGNFSNSNGNVPNRSIINSNVRENSSSNTNQNRGGFVPFAGRGYSLNE